MLGLAFVASVEPTASGEPGHGALDHPAVSAQSLRGLDAAPGDARSDVPLAEPSTQGGIVVAFVAVEFRWSSEPRPAGASDRRDPPDQRLQGQAVMGVGGRDGDGDGQAGTVDDKMDFRSRLAAVGRIRSGQLPPLRARTLTESTANRDQSNAP